MADFWDIAGDLGGLVLGGVGFGMQAGGNARQEELQDQAIQDWLALDVPEYQEYQHQRIAPERGANDPQAMAARKAAYEAILAKGDEGYNAMDRAAIGNMLNETALAARGARGAAMRGAKPGSVQAMLGNQMANQASYSNASNEALNLAAASRMQALKNIMAGSQMAGDYNRDVAGMSQFNAAQGNAVNRFNEMNRIGQAQYGNTLRNMAYGNRLQRLSGLNEARGLRGKSAKQNAAGMSSALGGLGQALPGIGRGIGSMFGGDKGYGEGGISGQKLTDMGESWGTSTPMPEDEIDMGYNVGGFGGYYD